MPESIIAGEKDVAAGQMAGKPENMLEKIIEGKLKAFYDQVCLVNQKYIKDDRMTITELVDQHGKQEGKPLKLVQFIRWVVGQ